MKYKPFRLKIDNPDEIELPDGIIITSSEAHPEYFMQDPKDWKVIIYGLEPVRRR